MRIIIAMIALIALALIPGYVWSDASKGDVEVGVRALVKNPEEHKGEVHVEGVVSQVASEAKMFGLIDLEEFKTCQKVTCASLILPIQWDGTMPEVGQQLTVMGEIQKEGKRYLFNASKVDIVSSQ